MCFLVLNIPTILYDILAFQISSAASLFSLQGTLEVHVQVKKQQQPLASS